LKIRGDLIAGSVDLQCRKEPWINPTVH
jgi:hypothetical protein